MVLLYTIDTDVPFDMANVVFQVIVSYAESKSTLGGLPFPFLIHEILNVQKEGLADKDDLDMPRKPLSISSKVYTRAHVQDVGNEDVDIDLDNPVTDSVATSSFMAPISRPVNSCICFVFVFFSCCIVYFFPCQFEFWCFIKIDTFFLQFMQF